MSNVAKLAAIFKRSFDLSMSFDGWSSQIGSLDLAAADYINDFAEILIQKYPTELESFRKIKYQKIKKLSTKSYFSTYYEQRLKKIEEQPIPDYIYQIHRSLFIKSKSLIKKGLALDLLSKPTHTPCWIAPITLIDRIISYEKSNEEISLYDFQIAIGRLPMHETPPNIAKYIDKIKGDEVKNVLRYHFDLSTIQSSTITQSRLWIQSVLSKNTEIAYFQAYVGDDLQKERGAYHWDCKLRAHFYKEYDYTLKKQVRKKMTRKELKFKDFNFQKTKSNSLIFSLKGIFNKKKIEVSSIYEYMHFKKEQYFTTIQANDDVKFLFLAPNNPSMFLSHVIHSNLHESTFSNESSKKNMINLLKGLYEIWYRADYKEPTYLFLATGLLCSDKVARELAAEIWIKANAKQKINNRLLGKIIGELESGEYAPLKRFTDLLMLSLFNVSKRHNESLFNLLDNMISNMSHTPIRGIKKLLEIFLAVKHTSPAIEISQLSKEKLSKWKETKTLESIINSILK